jgi:hypothetical protein
MTESQAEAVKESESWVAAVESAEDLKTINQLVGIAKERKLSPPMKVILSERATALGMAFDKKSGVYEIPAVV